MEIFIVVPFDDILLRVIKSRGMRLAGYVASTGRRMFTKEEDTWEDLDING
jgi:hypothetical protein